MNKIMKTGHPLEDSDISLWNTEILWEWTKI